MSRYYEQPVILDDAQCYVCVGPLEATPARAHWPGMASAEEAAAGKVTVTCLRCGIWDTMPEESPGPLAHTFKQNWDYLLSPTGPWRESCDE